MKFKIIKLMNFEIIELICIEIIELIKFEILKIFEAHSENVFNNFKKQSKASETIKTKYRLLGSGDQKAYEV